MALGGRLSTHARSSRPWRFSGARRCCAPHWRNTEIIYTPPRWHKSLSTLGFLTGIRAFCSGRLLRRAPTDPLRAPNIFTPERTALSVLFRPRNFRINTSQLLILIDLSFFKKTGERVEDVVRTPRFALKPATTPVLQPSRQHSSSGNGSLPSHCGWSSSSVSKATNKTAKSIPIRVRFTRLASIFSEHPNS